MDDVLSRQLAPSPRGAVLESCGSILSTVFIFYLIFKPVSWNFALYPALAIVGIIAAVAIVRHGLTVSMRLLAMCAIWAAAVALGTIIGVSNGAGYVPEVLAYLFAVPAFFFFVSHAVTPRIVRVIFSAGLILTISYGVILIGFVSAVRLGFEPTFGDPISRFWDIFVNLDIHGVVAHRAYVLSSFLWWTPIWVTSLFFPAENPFLPAYRWRMVAAIAAVVVVGLSWRRGMILALAFTPFLIAATVLLGRVSRAGRITHDDALSMNSRSVSSKRTIRNFAACAAVAAVILIPLQPHLLYLVKPPTAASSPRVNAEGGTVPASAESSDVGGVVGDKSESVEIRAEELGTLTHVDSPAQAIFGHGVGVEIPRGDSRPEVRPFQTELQYHHLFFEQGLVGLASAAAVLGIGITLIRRGLLQRSPLTTALFLATVGAFAVLVGNGTNPYIQAPGQYWPIVFPIMIYLAMLRDNPQMGTTVSQRRILGVNVRVVRHRVETSNKNLVSAPAQS